MPYLQIQPGVNYLREFLRLRQDSRWYVRFAYWVGVVHSVFVGLMCLLALSSLAACGGGSEDDGRTEPLGDFSAAVPVNVTLTGSRLDHTQALTVAVVRRHVLSTNAAAAPAQVPTNDELFAWAQRLLPSLFPGSPATQTITTGGASYVYRYYAVTNTYLGVRTDGGVFVLHANGQLVQYGFIADYTCDVLRCGSVTPTDAGSIGIEIDRHTVTPKVYDGKILGTSGSELNPADLDKICIEGPNHGFADTRTCGTYQNGKAEIRGVSNNDRVQYVGRRKGTGERIWLTIDPSATTRFTFLGLNAVYVNGFVEYSEFVQAGQPVYRKPTARVESGNLVLAFGRNRLSGFGLSGDRTDFTSGSYQFRFQPRSGDVKAMATAVWHDATKELRVVFAAELKCTDTGTITVHRQIVGGGYSTSVAGWLSIGRGTETEPVDIIWSFTAPGVVPVMDTGAGFYGFRYQRTGC